MALALVAISLEMMWVHSVVMPPHRLRDSEMCVKAV